MNSSSDFNAGVFFLLCVLMTVGLLIAKGIS